MKLVSFLKDENAQLGLLVNEKVYDLNKIDSNIPDNMAEFLVMGDEAMELARIVEKGILNESLKANAVRLNEEFMAPVPFPTSCRDGYAFRQHVETARRNRGVGMIPEFDQYPIFYFTNHNSIQGPGPIMCMPDHFHKLDFELEASIVIGKHGRNITASEADSYIAGYMIMNDMSARTLQMEEMLLNLGPAKGKDFCTVVGPWLVTPDELAPYLVATKAGHTGNQYNLEMQCWVNGDLVSEGNMCQMDWTFAEIVERASYGVDLFPGDIIGSGTVGTGCFLELNGSARLKNPAHKDQWLLAGDVVDMEITGLGKLSNIIIAEETAHSLLKLKKNLA